MKISVPKLACTLLAAGFLLGQAQARVPSFTAASPSATEKAKKSSTRKSSHEGQAKFVPGSEETPRERSSRLKRECKGRVNAGACAGYTY